MSVEHVPVVVIGAGPTGVTAATLLAQYGVDCLILDRWPQVFSQPRAVHLDDEVFRIVARLGVADRVAEISRPALGLRLVERNMNVLAEFRRATTLSRNGFPQANMFDQPELETVLRDNLSRFPSITLRSGVEVTDIDIDTDTESVALTYSDDTGEHLVRAAYLLGCDGANSLTRRRIGSTMEDLGFQQRWLVVDIATAADLGQWDGVHQVCDPDRAATYMRIGDTRHRWEFQLWDTETAEHYSTLETLAPLLRPWLGRISTDALTLVRVAEYTFKAQMADRWRVGRVFLLGDAAHLTPPFIGQGMGSGLRDAMNLTWKLAGVLRGALPDEALDTYVQERKPHTRSMIRLALVVGRAMTAGGELGSLARRVGLPALRRAPGFSAKVIGGETPPLRRSSLVKRSGKPRQLAGRLCPNPLVSAGRRLDTELGSGFAIVTTDTPSTDQRSRIARRGVTLHVTAADSALGQWLRRGRATAALIRPDRTVMHACRDLDALCDSIPCHRPLTETSRLRR